jgi:hypothetical protein
VKRFLNRLTDWAHWPFLLFYAPIALAWPWYYLRSRSLWFFTSANPTITFGGFEGEAKSEMYRQLPAHLLPRSLFIKPRTSFAEVLQQLQAAGLDYPFIVKPDVGMKGLLFRKIERETQLETYHRHIPVDYIIQEYLNLTLEVSVFYYRRPGSATGRITAFIQKDLLEVKGDGQATLGELVQRHPGVQDLMPKIRKQYGDRLGQVLPGGEVFTVLHVANLFNGASFKNLAHLVDADMLAVFDNISIANAFYYGRYDIKCRSVADLKKGRGFYILEFNGAGSTPNHIYTGTYTLLQAYRELLLHWRLLYEASALNHKRGHRYWPFLKGHRFLKVSRKHFNMLKKLDSELELT